MKNLTFILVIFITSISAHAENSIFGKWEDKSDPTKYKYEFIKGHDFIFTHNWETKGKAKTNTSKGVWDIGEWIVTSSSGNKKSCNLTVYAGTSECCFNMKFLANNLILTKKYDSSGYGVMCENRVLVKSK